jgi:tripartite-type tricarboxylate transporter receptor subunit TctC
MRQLQRWTQICAFSFVSILPLSTPPSFAQSWPQRSVRIIVPFGPGSSPDVAARTFADQLSPRWHQPVIIENRPGADGLIGTAAFVAAQDDHVLLFTAAAPLSVYPIIQERLSYDPVRDVVPVSIAVNTFGTISVPSSLPVTTLSELVGFARSRPGQLNWASGGGAFPILMTGFVRSAGLEISQVSYRDQNLAVQDTAEGRIQVFATAMTAVLPMVQAGKVRVLAVTNHDRSPLWPHIPTAIESGHPGLTFEGLIGLFAPRGTPDERRERISAEIRAIAADKSIATRLGAAGQIVRGSSPAEFSGAIEEQRAQLADIIRRTGKLPQ